MINVASVVFGVACLLAAFSLLMPMSRRLNLPYTVALALFGIFIGTIVLQEFNSNEAARGFLGAIGSLRLPAEGYLFIFLPPLLFSAGLTIDVRRMLDEFVPIVLLAVVAVGLCTFIVGFAVGMISGMPLVVCVLLGSIVATTDSAAVLAIFRDLGVPKRLLILVEGESLFNDAAAIAIFTAFFAILTSPAPPSVWQASLNFFIGLLGGALVGYLLARATAIIIGYMRDAIMAETTLTVALAYITYYVAEANLGVSGVTAVVVAAITFAIDGRARFSPGAWVVARGIWRMLDFWATSLIFIMAAMVVPGAMLSLQITDLWAIGGIFVATLFARFVVLYGLIPLMARFGRSEPISGDYKRVLWWGGLRGAVTIALALAIAENPAVPGEVGRFILVASTGYVLATLLIQAPTLRPLMRFLKMAKLTERELLVRDRVMEVSRLQVKNQVAEIAEDIGLMKYVEQATQNLGGSESNEVVMGSDDRMQVALLALSRREEEIYFEYLQKGIVSRQSFEILRAHAGRISDATKTSGLFGYQAAAFVGLKWSIKLRMALAIQRRFGWQTELSKLLAERFEALLIIEIALHELREFARTSVKELVGDDTVSRICDVLLGRIRTVEGALKAVSLQFPSFAEGLNRRYLDRVALGLEEAQYRRQLSQSVITPEVFEDLEADRLRRLHAIDVRPRLDLGLKLSQMLANVPLFSVASKEDLARIARQLRPQLALPSERVIRQGEIGNCMYFIASGEVRVKLPDSEVRLSDGDYVGELALLTKRPRNADVVANGYCHLLVLDRGDFRRLCRENPELRKQIEKTAAARLETEIGHATSGL